MEKFISSLIPCFNNPENVLSVSKAVEEVLQNNLPQYNHEIILIDNCSPDNTRPLLRELCKRNKKKEIFNTRSFGQFKSLYDGRIQTNGNRTVCMYCDFTFFWLYDKMFIDVLWDSHDSTPVMRGIVSELGFRMVDILYRRARRKADKAHNNWHSLFDVAILSFTSYTKVRLRFTTFSEIIISLANIVIAICYLVHKFFYWSNFSEGIILLIIGMFLLGGIRFSSLAS